MNCPFGRELTNGHELPFGRELHFVHFMAIQFMTACRQFMCDSAIHGEANSWSEAKIH